MEEYFFASALHSNQFDGIRKNMMYKYGSKHDSARNGRNVPVLERLQSCCHHSLTDLCVDTDGA